MRQSFARGRQGQLGHPSGGPRRNNNNDNKENHNSNNNNNNIIIIIIIVINVTGITTNNDNNNNDDNNVTIHIVNNAIRRGQPGNISRLSPPDSIIDNNSSSSICLL